MKPSRSKTRHGIIWMCLGILVFFVGIGFYWENIGTREHPFAAAAGLAMILTSLGMNVWGLAQILGFGDVDPN